MQPGRVPPGVAAEQPRLAAVRLQQAEQNPERGRLVEPWTLTRGKQPGRCRRRRVGGIRHPARGRRRTRQQHPAPGRRRLRPRRPHPVRTYPGPSPAGNQLRQAARLIGAFAYLTGDRTLTPVTLMIRLAALDKAVAELRESQQRAAQATAARTAAEHLYAAARPAPPAQPPPGARASTAAQLAGLSFPQPARTAPQRTAPGQPGPTQGGPPPARRSSPPRPRGPSR